MTTTQNRKPATPTHGTCRLISGCALPLPAALDAGEALLSITPDKGAPTSYLVLRLADKSGRTLGYRLTRLADYLVDRKLYDIAINPWGLTCDCPDAEFNPRPEGCKHVRALRSALAHAGIALSSPANPAHAPEDDEMMELTAEPLPVDELHEMRCGEVCQVNGRQVERVACGWMIDGRFAITPRQLAELLS